MRYTENVTTTRFVYGDDASDRNLELGRLAATRLDNERIASFAADIRRHHTGLNSYTEDWLEAVKRGPEAIRNVLVDETDYGRVMRSSVLLRAFVTREERRAVLRPEWKPGDLLRCQASAIVAI